MQVAQIKLPNLIDLNFVHQPLKLGKNYPLHSRFILMIKTIHFLEYGLAKHKRNRILVTACLNNNKFSSHFCKSSKLKIGDHFIKNLLISD